MQILVGMITLALFLFLMKHFPLFRYVVLAAGTWLAYDVWSVFNEQSHLQVALAGPASMAMTHGRKTPDGCTTGSVNGGKWKFCPSTAANYATGN